MTGVVKTSIDRRGNETYEVVVEMSAQNEPEMLVRTYQVTRAVTSYNRSPSDGDVVSYRMGMGSWVGGGYELWTDGDAVMTTRPIPPPPKKIMRGRPVRYQDGRWQVRTAKGWQ